MFSDNICLIIWCQRYNFRRLTWAIDCLETLTYSTVYCQSVVSALYTQKWQFNTKLKQLENKSKFL